MELSNDNPKQWPAWNMDFDQEQAAPIAYVAGPAIIRVKESGPVRVAIEVSRRAMGSKFVQTISLAAGSAGDRVEFSNAIDWRSKSVNLKAAFPLTASNPNATYNEEVGTVERPNAFDRQFETFSHRWIDLTDQTGKFGATILTEAKNASDKPNDSTIRLTLLRTPGLQPQPNGRPAGYSDQANQDWGHHEFSFGITGHAGGWREAQSDWQGYRLNDPLRAFSTTKHAGTLGRSFSLVSVSNPRVRILGLKKAENGDETVIRMVELDGKAAPDVRIQFPVAVAAAREINGQEQAVGSARVADGSLVTSFSGYQPRTFAVKFATPGATATPIRSQPVTLPYNVATASNDDTKTVSGGMDGKGNAYPAEMLPAQISLGGVNLQLANAASGVPNAVVAAGQSIPLPSGQFNRIYILAASASGDQDAQFHIGSEVETLKVQDWGGFIGQWDTRLWKGGDDRNWASSAHHQDWPGDMKAREAAPRGPVYPDDYLGLRAGYVKPAQLAWYASHHHTADGLNTPYQYSYVFAYVVDVPANAKVLTLPKNDKIRIFAISLANEPPSVVPAQRLYDALGNSEQPKPVEKNQ